MRPQSYLFRAVTPDDLPLLAGWLAEPHIKEWWGEDADASLAEIVEAVDSISTEPLIVELDGRPIAYIQSYDPHLEEDHPYQDQPFGTLGVDLSIGDPTLVGIGHGSAILRQFTDLLFAEGTPRVIIDPDPANLRAIHAYKKAGFRIFDRRISEYGPAVMMAHDTEGESDAFRTDDDGRASDGAAPAGAD